MKRAQDHAAGIPKGGGTVYLTTADERGMMVSFIQSNYMGFGSGVVVPGTGISLQNRGAGFSLEPGHPNQVGPRKRPFHTIIPGFLTRDGQPVMSFGVMGGNMQPQGHVQMIVRLVDYNQNPQACSDGAALDREPGLQRELRGARARRPCRRSSRAAAIASCPPTADVRLRRRAADPPARRRLLRGLRPSQGRLRDRLLSGDAVRSGAIGRRMLNRARGPGPATRAVRRPPRGARPGRRSRPSRRSGARRPRSPRAPGSA